MINNGLTLAVSSIINIIIAFRIFPGLKLAFSYIDKAVFKKLFNFGSKLQVSYFANLVSFHTDKLLISYFLGVGLVAFYQLASSLLQQIRQVPLLLISALIPAVSEITAKDDKESLKRLYLSGSKFLILVSAPLTVFVIAGAPLIISAWMGGWLWPIGGGIQDIGRWILRGHGNRGGQLNLGRSGRDRIGYEIRPSYGGIEFILKRLSGY